MVASLLGLSGACSETDEPGDAEPDGSGATSGEGGSSGKGGSAASGPPASGGKSVLPDPVAGSDGEAGEGAGGVAAEPGPYVMSSIAFSAETTATYISLLGSLDIDEVDFARAREFAGQADLWVHDGAVFVSELDSLTITKFTLDGGKLVQGDTLSLANYGLTDIGFYLNSFVAPDKAYFMNAGTEYVIWNPKTMEIIGTIPIPKLEPHDGLRPFPSYSDRSAVLRDGKLYHPVYYTDDSYFEYSPTSSILVVDVGKDEVVDVLEAPCPGLDFASRDEHGNAYFSSWVFAPGGAAVLDQPTTCVAKLAAGEEALEKLFDFPEVTAGRQGGAMRCVGDGKALLSVLHDERATSDVVSEVTYGANWQFWLYDLADGTASPVASIPFNAGAAYDANLEGKPHLLVPAGDYASTQLFEIFADGTASPRVGTLGWSMRLFALN
jgi:hypothetical protein